MVHQDQRAGKGARNQALWRHVNERIESVMDDAANPEFICECANMDCTKTLQLTIAEYEAVRESPARFPVAPGHIFPQFERVVEENERYMVVEKFGVAGDIAEQLDPRRGERA
jgi:hypothetical protein